MMIMVDWMWNIRKKICVGEPSELELTTNAIVILDMEA